MLNSLATEPPTTQERVRNIVLEMCLSDREGLRLGDDDDLYVAGMTSRSSVHLMMALEEEFGMEFPDELLRREVFQNVTSIARAVDRLRAEH